MKINEVYDEMLEIAKKIGVTVRKGSGKLHGGNCKINDEEVIVLNKSIPLERRTSMLAKCLSHYSMSLYCTMQCHNATVNSNILYHILVQCHNAFVI